MKLKLEHVFLYLLMYVKIEKRYYSCKCLAKVVHQAEVSSTVQARTVQSSAQSSAQLASPQL